MCAGSRQYCRYTKSPLVITPFKENLGDPSAKENLTLVGFEPTTSGLDLPMLYRLSYEARTVSDRGNLDSESRQCSNVGHIVSEPRSTHEIGKQTLC